MFLQGLQNETLCTDDLILIAIICQKLVTLRKGDISM